MGRNAEIKNPLVELLAKLLIVSTVALSGCNKKLDNRAFVYTTEVPPSSPVIISPTANASYTTYSSNVRIVGCFKASCNPNTASWTVQASGAGTLSNTSSHFTFDATMLVGETRVFSFTFTNSKGQISTPTTLTILFDSSFQLTPMATLYNGGSSVATPVTSTNAAYKLSVLTTLPSLVNSQIVSSNGYVLTSGALNPQ